MTDNEIIKALECWTKLGCKGCPFLEQGCFDCGYIPTDVSNEILDLINRQKAENESLKVDLVKCSIRLDNLYKTANEIKSEAIKEFAEKLKHLIIPQKADGYTREIVLKSDIDNLVKEMTEVEE